MSPLASAIYAVLRQRVPAMRPEISYANLLGRLPAPWHILEPEGPHLADALAELVLACREKGLPAISAIVIHHRHRAPGPRYYAVAHPSVAGHDAQRMVAWGVELEQVGRTTYPTAL